MFKVVEVMNPLAVHAICRTLKSAKSWIDTYGDSGLFTDKTLTKDSFMIIQTA